MHLKRSILAATMLVIMTATGAAAQQGHTVDVSRLPIDLGRIQRELRQIEAHKDEHGLDIQYIIDVYGQAPPLVLIAPGTNLMTGPVPHSAPTHRQMLDHVTPEAFRAPVMNLGALVRWLTDRNEK